MRRGHTAPQAIGKIPHEGALVGWAMDGFPIYGALADVEAERDLDPCNGRFVDGSYRYHVCFAKASRCVACHSHRSQA